MKLNLKSAAIAAGLVAASATGAAAQRTGVNPNTPAPSCTTTSCRPDTTINNVETSNRVRANVLMSPNMAVSNGWCMDTLSGVIGGGAANIMATLGLTKSQFSQACGRWYTISAGAGNAQCIPAMTSLAIANGEQPLAAVQNAVNDCAPAPRGRRTGPALRN